MTRMVAVLVCLCVITGCRKTNSPNSSGSLESASSYGDKEKVQPLGRPFDPPQNSFDGNSEALQQTVVVPTLDTPIPDKKSAIWCSSFQLAWKHLKNDVTQGPIQLENAQAVSDRLNRAEQTEDDLDVKDFYSAAGMVKDGIAPKIQAEMGQKFPDVPAPMLDVPADGAVAYGYMRAQVIFQTPFFDNDEPFSFTDSSGNRTNVKSFGIRKKDDYAYATLREQVQVLYSPREKLWREQEVDEFVVDPCKLSRSYQIIVACIGRKASLAEAVADVQKKIASTPADDFASHIHPRDSLLIPSLHWRLRHRFKELEGKDKRFLNPKLKGLFLDTALQTIEFRLDRSGAELSSESKVYVKPSASHFCCNRPFLVLMKKRDGKQPFFVMWVENAELLDK